ncbi:glycine/D-amino acid oxidase [Corynebacterium suranareeae]|uniref:glycine oxidase n=1 Tax=Corynebacterium suranareeae TaxID=2506452 RepID=A0A160PT31_9CORY|nr:glycine oxidase ThiO [Corynebacterium suranareeae]BAU96373.1 glycine/D-amino acid oxidase [Corynebacterium suranareeae]
MTKSAIVIGGGIIGLTTCFEFQEAGFQVTLIDPDPISGATHHAGGMLAPTAEVQYQQQDLIQLMKESARLYPDLLERVSKYTDLPTGYRTEGTLLVGADRTDGLHVAELIKYMHLMDLPVDFLTTRQARSAEPALSPRISKVVNIDGDHQVAPRLYARALLDAILQRGAEHIADTVISIDGHDPCLTVTMGSGVRVASKSVVVLAAGLGAARIPGWFEGANPLQLRPVYGDIIRVRVPEKLQPMVSKVIRGFVEDRQVYIIPRDDGTLAIGATSREDHPHPKTGSVYDLLRDATRLVPGIEETEFLEVTCGARPGTPDDIPYLGWVGSNVIVSTGYFRHGILLAALGARAAVDLATKKPVFPTLDVCDPFRHRT